MNIRSKVMATFAAVAIAALALTGCTPSDASRSYDKRVSEQKATQLDGKGQEAMNLEEKTDRENDPSAIRYLYLMNFGQVVGYYVTKGKISSNGSQVGPESELVRPYSDYYVVDSAQDDGSYGAGDPGIFFFTTEGVMVVTSLDYVQADAPLPIDVPRLGGTD